MKGVFATLILIFVINGIKAQNSAWFKAYDDSAVLVKDAQKIANQINQQVNKIKPGILPFQNKVVLNTTDMIIYIDSITVNLSMWNQLSDPIKGFMNDISGGDGKGKELFGKIFNGYFLAHEIGHAIHYSAGVGKNNPYDEEYAANVFAVLYWRSVGENDQLADCYQTLKQILNKLNNPVPPNENFKEYVTKNFQDLAMNPYNYAYIQFSQIVSIYEDNTNASLDSYINGLK